jgi:hypothetical protein
VTANIEMNHVVMGLVLSHFHFSYFQLFLCHIHFSERLLFFKKKWNPLFKNIYIAPRSRIALVIETYLKSLNTHTSLLMTELKAYLTAQ